MKVIEKRNRQTREEKVRLGLVSRWEKDQWENCKQLEDNSGTFSFITLYTNSCLLHLIHLHNPNRTCTSAVSLIPLGNQLQFINSRSEDLRHFFRSLAFSYWIYLGFFEVDGGRKQIFQFKGKFCKPLLNFYFFFI